MLRAHRCVRNWTGDRENPHMHDDASTPLIRRIPIRREDVWTFTQRNVPLWDILELFPRDAIGPRGPADAPRPYEVRPITIETDRKSTRLNSSHRCISYAVFCLKKKKQRGRRSRPAIYT